MVSSFESWKNTSHNRFPAKCPISRMDAVAITFPIRPEKDVEAFFAFANEKYDVEQTFTWAFWKPFPELKKMV